MTLKEAAALTIRKTTAIDTDGKREPWYQVVKDGRVVYAAATRAACQAWVDKR